MKMLFLGLGKGQLKSFYPPNAYYYSPQGDIHVKQSTLVCVAHVMPIIVNLISKTHFKANWKVCVDKDEFICIHHPVNK